MIGNCIENYREFCKRCNERIPLKSFDLGIFTNFTNTFHMIGISSADQSYNSMRARVPHRMEKIDENVYIVKLMRMFEAYGAVNVNMYPGESIQKIELKIGHENYGQNFPGLIYTIPYNDLYLEITFSHLEYEYDRITWIDAFLYETEDAVKMTRIYTEIFEKQSLNEVCIETKNEI